MQNAPAKITRLSKALSAVLLVFFAVQFFVPSSRAYLALVPGRTLPCVWNLVTAGFLSTNIVKVVVEVALLLFLSRLVEPMYGSKEFLKFIIVVNVAVCCTVFVGVYVVYIATSGKETKDAGKLLYREFCGFHGVIAALLVAVKQVMPDHEMKLLGLLRVKVRYVPTLALLAATPLFIVVGQATEYLPFIFAGTYLGWVYLRFFQQQAETAYKGDPSDDFKFSSFFPSFMGTPIDAVAGIFSLVFRLRHDPNAAEAKPLHMSNAPSMLGSDAADANRRRERGAKALEERLGMKKQQQGEDVEKGSVQSSSSGAQ